MSATLIEQFAEELHKDYRAANKALYPGGSTSGGAHDHGWQHCHRKQYFRKRAAAKLREAQQDFGTQNIRQICQALVDLCILYGRRPGSNPAKVSGTGNTEKPVVEKELDFPGR